MNFFISEYLFYRWSFCSSGPTIGNDPLNLNDILQSVSPTNFGSNSTRKRIRLENFFLESTPSVGHPAMTRQYPSTSLTHNITVSLFEFNDFFIHIFYFRILLNK
jgi:hypothetical protein